MQTSIFLLLFFECILQTNCFSPSKDEIRKEFRKLIIEWHPDKNPDNPLAEEKTKQLIQAYEYLSGEDAQAAFKNIDKTDYFWVDISNYKTI